MIGPDGKGAWRRPPDDGHRIDEEQWEHFRKKKPHPYEGCEKVWFWDGTYLYRDTRPDWFFLGVCVILLILVSSFIGVLLWTKTTILL